MLPEQKQILNFSSLEDFSVTEENSEPFWHMSLKGFRTDWLPHEDAGSK